MQIFRKKYLVFSKNGQTYEKTDKQTNQQTDKFDWPAQLKLKYSNIIGWKNFEICHYLRTRIFPDIQFDQNLKGTYVLSF